jgi:phosphatidylserine decarboxylase
LLNRETLTVAEPTDARLGDLAFALLQRMLPTRWLSLQVYRVTQSRRPWLKNLLLRLFLSRFKVDLNEAVEPDPYAYESFNAFFTRALKADARPLQGEPDSLISPADGAISQFGPIRGGRIFQAKGHDYSAAELLGDAALADAFLNGDFCTIYLAPHNYHRLHMPLSGRLREWRYLPGRLFSVNPATARAMPGLFARNERVVTVFDTEFGPMAMVLVGALFVGSVDTVWAGRITPPHLRGGLFRYGPQSPVELARGAEMGRFNMGSTVILLTPPGAVRWDSRLRPAQALRMGEMLGRVMAP